MGELPVDDAGPAVPFTFRCQRSGRCCTAGEGFVWLAEGEAARLAAALGLEEPAFRARFVRTAVDPGSGALREALREDPPGSGRCALLEGRNHCAAYDARPEHCASFPYWPRVLGDPEAFERARAVCPGIAVRVPEELRRRAFDRLEALYAEVDAAVGRSGAVCIRRGLCCRFEEAGHELWATALEADYAAERGPDAPPPEAPGRCPYHQGGLCTARGARALGCRTYHCDRRTEDALERTHEWFLGRVREIERELGYPAAYGRFPEMLAARGVGEGGG